MTQKGSRVYTLISGATLIHFYRFWKLQKVYTRQFHYAKRVISRGKIWRPTTTSKLYQETGEWIT